MAMMRLEGLGKFKNPMTSGIKTMTFWLVAKYLKQLRYHMLQHVR
jgi:hypothetical protein